MLRIRNIFLYPDFIFNLTAMGREQQRKMNLIHSFTDKVNANTDNELIYNLYFIIYIFTT